MQATLSHYRVLEQIGQGGMGVVYRAHDERLDRDVALKVLPAGALADDAARKRFHKEALTLSKLNHPNIATIFDFDTQDRTDFLVEELIRGLSLDEMLQAGPLPEKEIISLGAQLCEGLAAAHEHGVIHLDLKPTNIRVTPDARVKILDFGLAKLTAACPADVTASITETQSVSGTLPYMAPEQLLNGKLDARSDIWAAGCVLYEMATGRRPFSDSGPALTDEILHKAAVPPQRLNPGIAPRLEEVLLKCLEKEPGQRYQSAKELGVDLRRVLASETALRPVNRPWYSRVLAMVVLGMLCATLLSVTGYLVLHRAVRPAPVSGRIMLAVLPVENWGADAEQEYFSDGLTEELIACLGTLQPKRLGVIARTSAMRYKKTDKSIGQIGRELGVDYVLESSVRREAGRARITAQLIQVSDQTHLWAESYERELASVLGVQSEVAQRVASSLAVELLPTERRRLAGDRPVNLEAHDLYLRGRYYWNKRTPADLWQAKDYFQRATELDPTYALAFSGLADTYTILGAGNYAVLPPRDAMPKAEAAARQALALNPALAEAHATLGYIRTYFDWDWRGAEREFQKAIELNPSYATAHQWYALLLGGLGRFPDALDEIREAGRLDPLSLIISADTGHLLGMAGQYGEAIAQLKKTLEMDPNFATAHEELAEAYAGEKRYAEAISEMEIAIGLAPSELFWKATLASFYAQAGQREKALGILKILNEQSKSRYVPASGLVIAYIALGDIDEAFIRLEQAYADREDILTVLQTSPSFDALRSDPRFHDLVRRMSFPQ